MRGTNRYEEENDQKGKNVHPQTDFFCIIKKDFLESLFIHTMWANAISDKSLFELTL